MFNVAIVAEIAIHGLTSVTAIAITTIAITTTIIASNVVTITVIFIIIVTIVAIAAVVAVWRGSQSLENDSNIIMPMIALVR